MNLEQAEAQLKTNGYSEVAFHEDPPDFEYPEHDHPVDTAYIVTKGEMAVFLEGAERKMREGDRLDIGKHILHSAKIGGAGCTFLIGVRI